MRRILLLTANVGSLFEAGCKLHDQWVNTIAQRVIDENAEVVVIHMQETGGKNFAECCSQVPGLIQKLIDSLPRYPTVRAFLDIEYEVPTFTALGSLVFIHESAIDYITQYNFDKNRYDIMETGVMMVTADLESHALIVKRKFPKHFWPAIKWGRKGYMQTRFKVHDRSFDFVNVHLFHDESNLALIHENPRLYSSNRKRALDFVLEQLASAENGCLPHLFIFGDLNFRLDSSSFLNKLTERASPLHHFEDSHGSIADGLHSGNSAPIDPLRRTVSAIEFRRQDVDDASNGLVLRIEKKRFDYFNHKQLLNDWQSYLEDDKESGTFKQLHELPITFPPTYPWSENPDESEVMMKTRAPAWCDRVLMGHTALRVVLDGKAVYESFGRKVCTGDHKPVALAFSYPAS